MLFIFYLISKLFDDGQVVCAFVRRVNEREACADGAIENWRNLVLSFFFSLSPSWETGFHYECIAEKRLIVSSVVVVFKLLDTWTLPVACFATKHSPSFQTGSLLKIPLSLSQQGLEVELEPRGTSRGPSVRKDTKPWLLSNSCFQISPSSTGSSEEKEQLHYQKEILENCQPVSIVSKWGSNVFIE